METPDYQKGAHFEALDEGVLIAALKSTGYFSHFNLPESAVSCTPPFYWQCLIDAQSSTGFGQRLAIPC